MEHLSVDSSAHVHICSVVQRADFPGGLAQAPSSLCSCRNVSSLTSTCSTFFATLKGDCALVWEVLRLVVCCYGIRGQSCGNFARQCLQLGCASVPMQREQAGLCEVHTYLPAPRSGDADLH